MLAKKALSATAGAPKLYVEDVMSCFLYTGNNNTAQTITNNIDLSTEGGLIWFKDRSNVNGHFLIDTVRGANSQLRTHSTAAETTSTNYISSFNNNGFTLGTNGNINGSETQVSWTFRKAKKFFDVVTYTGNGVGGRTVSHNLGSTPGCILIKSTSASADWAVWHRGDGTTAVSSLSLNTPDSSTTSTVTVNSTEFSTAITNYLGAGQNVNGRSYVAYLFAHDAGGFGDAGSDSIIKCGSFTCDGSGNAEVNLGWEPQWLLRKRSDGYVDWVITDNMRGWTNGGDDAFLYPNLSDAEASANRGHCTATGFTVTNQTASSVHIYIAIRRGPMKTPTSGTSVFYPKVHAGTSSYSVGFPTDLCLAADQSGNALNTVAVYRLAGNNAYFGGTASTAAEVSVSVCQFDLQNSFQLSYNNNNQARWHFRRAPGFFDVVCYTGTGSQRTVSHNLGVAPELIIVKSRNDANDWAVYSSAIGNTKNLRLNTTAAESSALDLWASTTPSATTFTVTGTFNIVNGSTVTYVAYLFASVSGVSKVGSYTGNGSSQTINCGFTNGARFVLIKATSTTGDWVVFDSARGIVSGSDPYLRLNSTAAEVTDKDAVDTDNTGFIVNETTGPNVNTNGVSYIYLAIS